MYFESWSAFFEMGQHGPYVWSAYGVSMTLIVAELIRAWRQQARVKQAIRRQQRRQQQTEESS